jgi:hypothetical protein
MDTAPTDPELAVDPSSHCPHCGAGCDPTGLLCQRLTKLADLQIQLVEMKIGRLLAAGDYNGVDAMAIEVVSRNARRTAALAKRFHEDSHKTPEQRAAEAARRAAAAERALLRDKRHKVALSAEAVIKRESGPSDRENLLCDMHERLLHPDIEIALLDQDVSTIVMRVLHDLGIAPKNEIWSPALMAREIDAAHDELSRFEAERKAGEAAMAAGVDWKEGVEFTPPPGVVTKRGRFTFGPDGSVIAEEPRDVPQSEWPPDIVGGRDPPDTG